MQKCISYPLKTQKKHKQFRLTSNDLLQKLLDFKQTKETLNGYNQNKTKAKSGNLAKQISKSIFIGSQSYKEVEPIIIENHPQNKKDEIIHKLKKKSHVRQINQIWSIRNRTDSNYIHTLRKEEKKDFIQNASILLQEKLLENKLIQLCYQTQQLLNKSDQLELLNKILFENLKQHQNDHNNMQERKVLMEKLEQIIMMQKKQEKQLNQFKQLYQVNNEGRRVKTQTSNPQLILSLNQGYLGLKI
ncbi:unnamed protein product [Paramecium sonneborni]|uniref:Uncharacterized protein n=1 Tax=Paramecium sonneborni TaxID=65129 RepID=A0A8S1LPJ0_9CILI|nr:unnamed protein product [Paramecium sonneborni]